MSCDIWSPEILDQKKTEDQEQTKEEFPENEIQDQEEQFVVLDAAIEYTS